jgi:hypothetical protein
MIFRPHSFALPFAVPALALCATISGFVPSAVHAQDTPSEGTASTSAALTDQVSIDQATRTAVSTGPAHGAGDTTSETRGAVTVRPGGEVYSTPDLRVAVVGATETGGDANQARRALAAAYAAISVLPGYTNVLPREIAAATRSASLKRDALRTPEHQLLRQRAKADRTLSITVRPGDVTGDVATYTAVAELKDTTTGGLVGRGEGSFTATAGGADVATTPLAVSGGSSVTPSADLARDVRVNRNASVRERAVDGAVARAVFDLNRPLILRGAVLNKMARTGTKGAPLLTRISLGEMVGARTGAPVEFLSPQGTRIGYGTIVDLAAGESVATFAPEAAFGNLFINCEVRMLDNPPLARAGQPAFNIDEREFARFERQFGLALAIAGGIYLATK